MYKSVSSLPAFDARYSKASEVVNLYLSIAAVHWVSFRDLWNFDKARQMALSRPEIE